VDITTTINVRDEIEGARFGRFHLKLGLLICAILIVDGYDLYNAAYAAHYVAPLWHLDKTEIGVLLSSGLLGFALGSLAHGPVADRYGRRRVMLAALWTASFLSLAIALWAHSYVVFCGLRVLLGCALGILMPLSITYLNEFAPKRIANRFALWFFGIGWAVGSALAGVVARDLVPSFGWEALYFVGAGAAVLALLSHRLLPESLEFLAASRRNAQVATVLGKIRPDRVAHYAGARFSEPSAAALLPTSPAQLLAPRYRRTSLLLWTCGWLSLFASYGLSGWLPIVMLQRGETLGASFLFGSLLMMSNAVGVIGGGYIADAVGSRVKVLAVAWILGAAVMLAFAVSNSHWLNIVCVVAAGIFIVAPQSLLNNLFAVSYESRLRATGVGTALGIARLGAITGPAIAGMIQQQFQSTLPMFACLAGSLVVCAAVVVALGRGAKPAPVQALSRSVGQG
jgi:AAHS family 4-hydroxybenzoate transporter-like MFS transporter